MDPQAALGQCRRDGAGVSPGSRRRVRDGASPPREEADHLFESEAAQAWSYQADRL